MAYEWNKIAWIGDELKLSCTITFSLDTIKCEIEAIKTVFECNDVRASSIYDDLAQYHVFNCLSVEFIWYSWTNLAAKRANFFRGSIICRNIWPSNFRAFGIKKIFHWRGIHYSHLGRNSSIWYKYLPLKSSSLCHACFWYHFVSEYINFNIKPAEFSLFITGISRAVLKFIRTVANERPN